MTTCPIDGASIGDQARLCTGCTTRLRMQLLAVPGLLRELDQAAGRQTAMPTTPSHGAASCTHERDCGCGVRLPWDDRASRLAAGLRNAVTTWARVLLEETNAAYPGGRAVVLAVWLAQNAPTIRTRSWADAMALDVARRVKLAEQVIYPQPERFELGPCGALTDTGPCPRRLAATADQATVQCPTCQATHDVADKRAYALRSAAEELLPAVGIARMLTAVTGTHHPASTIRNAASDGRLVKRAPNAKGQPLYRVGDVLDLHATGRLAPTTTKAVSA